MKISINSDPKLLIILRTVVRWRAQEQGFSPPEVDSLALAIDEAASNVIRHTYGSRRSGRVALEIQTFSDRMEFVLEDSGPKVDPEKIRPRSLKEIRPGGLGTLFIQTYTDSNSYDKDCARGNRLRLVKFLPGKAPQDESADPEQQ